MFFWVKNWKFKDPKLINFAKNLLNFMKTSI